jgi:hypothetical protein
MTTIVTRAGKGSPLTNTEVDTNFTNLNSDKLEVNNASATGTFGLTGTLQVTGDSTLNGAVVINDAGADKDTRIEGDNDANLFFVDASTDRVGIGTATLSVKFSIAATDAMLVPVGTTGERPTGATGYLRFNSTTSSFEGHNGTAWGSIGGGATGGGADQMFYLNGQTVNTNYSIPSGQNAGTFGPITVASGATVTVPSGSTWTVV